MATMLEKEQESYIRNKARELDRLLYQLRKDHGMNAKLEDFIPAEKLKQVMLSVKTTGIAIVRVKNRYNHT